MHVYTRYTRFGSNKYSNHRGVGHSVYACNDIIMIHYAANILYVEMRGHMLCVVQVANGCKLENISPQFRSHNTVNRNGSSVPIYNIIRALYVLGSSDPLARSYQRLREINDFCIRVHIFIYLQIRRLHQSIYYIIILFLHVCALFSAWRVYNVICVMGRIALRFSTSRAYNILSFGRDLPQKTRSQRYNDLRKVLNNVLIR